MPDEMLLKIYERLGRVDEKQDAQTKLLKDHSRRLTSIEHSMERKKGAKGLIVWFWGCLIGLVGMK